MFNKALTTQLLNEELVEFITAHTDLKKLDALADIVYVAIGAMWKMGLSKNQIVTAMHIVCDSNDTKEVHKVPPRIKANIVKGPNYVPPDQQLEALLDERRN